MSDVGDQRAIAKAVLEERLQIDEVRQIAQLRRRTGSPIKDCLRHVLAMRPTVERQYVFIGTVGDESLEVALGTMTQSERDRLLVSGIESVGIRGATRRLGEKLLTLVGDKQLQDALISRGKTALEARICAHISRKVSDVPHND